MRRLLHLSQKWLFSKSFSFCMEPILTAVIDIGSLASISPFFFLSPVVFSSTRVPSTSRSGSPSELAGYPSTDCSMTSPAIPVIFGFFSARRKTPLESTSPRVFPTAAPSSLSISFFVYAWDAMTKFYNIRIRSTMENHMRSFILSPISSMRPTTRALPMQKYLILSVMPSVQLSGNPSILSHSTGVSILSLPVTGSFMMWEDLFLEPSDVSMVLAGRSRKSG